MTVLDAANSRLAKIFNEFDNVYVSFSGGKDSGVLLNLAIDWVRTNQPGRRIGVFHLDYEAQYQATTDYVDEVFSSNLDVIEPYRICMPIKAQCVTSMSRDHWVPWDPHMQEIWVRERPDSLNIDNHCFDFWKPGMWDYNFQDRFGAWYHRVKEARRTACLIGIRADESLNRWRAIHADNNRKRYKGATWTTKVHANVYSAYPIFDWTVQDIWTANARFGWSYNKVYDLYYQAGMSIHQMRVASPFNDAAPASLKLYRALDPNAWAKMVGRTDGVNFTGIYGGTTAMGWKSIKLPPGHTWESYMYFLIDTLPEQSRQNYLRKLDTSIKFWRDSGGVLPRQTIKKLRLLGVEVETSSSNRGGSDKLAARMEYLDDVDMPEFRQIPTFKRMCITIMKNDHHCKYMGFTPTQDEVNRKRRAMQDYINAL